MAIPACLRLAVSQTLGEALRCRLRAIAALINHHASESRLLPDEPVELFQAPNPIRIQPDLKQSRTGDVHHLIRHAKLLSQPSGIKAVALFS